MKYLLLVLAFCCSNALAWGVAASPGCIPQVAIGGGLPEGACSPAPLDPRTAAIRAFWDAYQLQPQKIFEAMAVYGVDADELEDALDYRVNIVHYMRANNAPDGLGGLKIWPKAEVDRIIAWAGAADTPWVRLAVQDALDMATARIELWTDRGWLHPDSIDPWNHPAPIPLAPQPVQPCVGSVCVVTGP